MDRMQELLVMCVSFIVKQGKKCVDGAGFCRYSGTDENGNNIGCAARPLFNEEKLAEQPDVSGAINVFFPNRFGFEPEKSQSFIKPEYRDLTQDEIQFVFDIQNVHDNFDSPFDYPKNREFQVNTDYKDFREHCIQNYKNLAEHYGLDGSFIDSL